MSMNDPVKNYWSPGVQDLVPYVPGEQPRDASLVKLNTNENPYPPSPRVVEALARAAQVGLQRYPDPTSLALRRTIARHHGLDADQVFVGNGSDEVLAHAFFAFFRQSAPLLMADVTYAFYQVYCRLYGIAPQLVPLDDALRIRVADYAGRTAGGVVLCNPNAPTGVALPLAEVEALLRSHPQCVVLVDEAYVDFGGDSAVGLIDRHPNLLVVHTLSKSRGLAGLRVGVAFGQRHLVEALERVKDSFNSYPLGLLAQVGAQAAYEDDAHFRATRDAVIASRSLLVEGLQALGLEVMPSSTNFVFARHPACAGAELAAGLRERGVLVRHFARPRIDAFLRITVGTPAQCRAVLDALRPLVPAAQ